MTDPFTHDAACRQVAAVLAAQPVIDDGDMMLWRALPTHARSSLGPFVFIDHYRHQSRRGIGDSPHPHAGIEVISYLLEGAVQHRDSMGFADRIAAGEMQCISAGRGMLHVEKAEGGRHGLQLWTSLPPERKRSEPTYRHIAATEIPSAQLGGATVKVLAGTVQGMTGPLTLARPTILVHVKLQAGAAAELAVDGDAELGLCVLDGATGVDGQGPFRAGQLVTLGSGRRVRLQAGEASDVMLLGGERAMEPMLFGGPFVMDTEEGLLRARQDFVEGRMGRLDGVPF